MSILNRILYFFYNFIEMIKNTWEWLEDYLETNDFLLEILYFVGLIIIGIIIIRLVINIFDRFN